MRPAFDALFDIDDAMGAVVARATDPTLGAIKLIWWRDALEALDSARPPAEPRLRAAAAELLPRGISGADLAQLEQGWAPLLHADDPEVVASRRPVLFSLAARLLGVPMNDVVEEAARAFAAADLGRRGISALVAPKLRRLKSRVARKVRPLTALGALGQRDIERGEPFEPEATPARAWTLLRHRLTGRL